MRQVLFRIPIPTPWGPDIPIFGFGAMLVIALLVCVWLAGRRAQKVGIAKELVQDLAFWIVIGGIVGARIVYMVQYGVPWWKFPFFWEGGIVFYGSLVGGAVGYLLFWYYVVRRQGVSPWKLLDVVAPAVALGLAIGRIGCLLNGCCYGDIAGGNCPAVRFPTQSFPGEHFVKENQPEAAVGFLLARDADDGRTVGWVDPSGPAGRVGELRPGDVVLAVNGKEVADARQLRGVLGGYAYDLRPDDARPLELTVRRDGQERTLPAFTPATVGLHPTQLYESVSMLLLFLVLLAYHPLRRRDGEVFALFLVCYPIHRFLNEILRNDTTAVAFDMTLSMNGSVLVFAAGLALWVWILRRPVQYHPFRGA